MASVDVVTGTDILATEYNLLRAEVVVNASAVIAAATVGGVNAEDIITTVATASGAAADVVTHAGVTANIHGLSAGIDVLGAYQSGLYIQYIKTDATVVHSAGGNSETNYISADWDAPFNNVGAVIVSCGAAKTWDAGAGLLEHIRHITFSVTSVTVAVRTNQSDATTGQIPLYVIGIGN